MPLAESRELYATYMAACSGSSDPRIKLAFETIHREDFLPPGPWKIFAGRDGILITTPSDNPIHLYQNTLIVLDEEKGINNGQPSLHAHWIGKVSPQPGEEVLHIGTGMGYYSAILATLVGDGGFLFGFEVDEALAQKAKENLKNYQNVQILNENAVEARLPKADIIYVNAGVAAPPVKWLEALKPNGRLIFPWRPSSDVGLGLLVHNTEKGYAINNLGLCSFIPCVGCDISHNAELVPDLLSARKTRSLWITKNRAPDDTATAIYTDLWFSMEEIEYQVKTDD